MENLPSNRVPLSQTPLTEDSYYQNISPNLPLVPQRPLLGLARGGSTQASEHFPRLGVQGQHKGHLVTNQFGRRNMNQTQARQGSGSIQERFGGTGVFLPYPYTFPTTPAPKSQQGGKSKAKDAKGAQLENKEESSCQLPPGICLPEEWTY